MEYDDYFIRSFLVGEVAAVLHVAPALGLVYLCVVVAVLYDEHEPVGRVQHEAEHVDGENLEGDGLRPVGSTGPLLPHGEDHSQPVEGQQADQEVWGGGEDLGVGHHHLQHLSQGQGAHFHWGVGVAQADQAVEQHGVDEVEQVR